jgi:hypothetical protein
VVREKKNTDLDRETAGSMRSRSDGQAILTLHLHSTSMRKEAGRKGAERIAVTK